MSLFPITACFLQPLKYVLLFFLTLFMYFTLVIILIIRICHSLFDKRPESRICEMALLSSMFPISHRVFYCAVLQYHTHALNHYAIRAVNSQVIGVCVCRLGLGFEFRVDSKSVIEFFC